MDETVRHLERPFTGTEPHERSALPELCKPLGAAVRERFLSMQSSFDGSLRHGDMRRIRQ